MRNRQRTTDKAGWTVEELETALERVKNGESIRRVSRETNIPYTTLHKRFKAGEAKPPKLGTYTVFTAIQEAEMAEHIKKLANIFYGLSPTDLRRSAYIYAEKNNIRNNFNKKSCMAGRDWLEGFLKRNPTISVRKPEATSLNRIKGFNKTEVDHFFQNVENVMSKYNFFPTEIYNIDESGMGTVQEPGVILAVKGQKRVGSVTSAERGKNITIICAMSAAGTFVPPMFIFARQRMSPTLEKDGPPGALYTCSKNGWTTEEHFVKWLEHFCQHVKPNPQRPVLLILDNHNSHSTIASYNFCKKNGIVVVSIPPHTSHRLQPLDVSFFGPLKKAYHRECDLYMKQSGNKTIRADDFACLFNKAYSNVANVSKGISGFKATGICPINPNIFGDEEFLYEDHVQKDNKSSAEARCDATLFPTNQSSTLLSEALVPLSPQPSTSSITNSVILNPQPSCSSDITSSIPTTVQVTIPFEKISPGPISLSAVKTKERKKQRSEILTATPQKILLEEKQNKRDEKERKKRRLSFGSRVKKAPPPREKRIRPRMETRKKRVRRTVNKKSQYGGLTSSSDESDVRSEELCDDEEDVNICEEDEHCALCGEYGIDGELWYRCTNCGRWAHRLCSGWDNPEGYLCDFCSRH